MWKYIGKEECNEFLLSLKLFNCKDKKKYLNTIYSISNNIENNYKIYKIKKKNYYIKNNFSFFGLIYFLYITSISSTHNLLSGAPQNLSPSLLDEQTIAKRYF